MIRSAWFQKQHCLHALMELQVMELQFMHGCNVEWKRPTDAGISASQAFLPGTICGPAELAAEAGNTALPVVPVCPRAAPYSARISGVVLVLSSCAGCAGPTGVPQCLCWFWKKICHGLDCLPLHNTHAALCIRRDTCTTIED